jgi:hypothetical protein
MRTTGTLQNVYNAAKDYYNGGDMYGGRPMNPVIRFENGKWMLESGINPPDNSTVECRLDDFDSYWYQTYDDEDYEISPEDEAAFSEAFQI